MAGKGEPPNICHKWSWANLLFLLTFVDISMTSVSMPCVKMPPIPLNARFTVRGRFTATLKCNKTNTDIALNAPGERGVLLCDPHAQFNYDLHNVWHPDCHPLKVPAKIRLEATISYSTWHCLFFFRSRKEMEIRAIIRKTFLEGAEHCGPLQYPCSPAVQFSCDQNYQYPDSPYQYQLDAKLTMTTRLVVSKGMDFYRSLIADVRRRVGCAEEDGLLSEAGRDMWHLKNAKLHFMHVSSWMGSCEEHANTVGTNLDRDGMISCRGCSEKYFLNQGECLPCNFNEYSGPFESDCHQCPRESAWDDRERWEDLCYIRP